MNKLFTLILLGFLSLNLLGQRVNKIALKIENDKVFQNNSLFNGQMYELYQSGFLKSLSNVKNGMLDGEVTLFTDNMKPYYSYQDSTILKSFEDSLKVYSRLLFEFQKDSAKYEREISTIFNEEIKTKENLNEWIEKYESGKLNKKKTAIYEELKSASLNFEKARVDLKIIREKNLNCQIRRKKEREKPIYQNVFTDRYKYSNGVKSGKHEIYSKDGKIIQEEYYTNDLLNGDFKKFDSYGKLIESGTFVYGKKEGEWKTYDSYGKLTKLESYKDNKKNGKYQEFQNDKLVTEGNYKDNLKEGEWIFHYPNYKEVFNYLNGLKEGIYEKKSSNKINILGSYLKDKKNGEWKEISPDGKLISLSTFFEDKLNGPYKKYNVFIFDNSDWDNNNHTISYNGGKIVEEEGEYVNNFMNGDWIYRYSDIYSDGRIRAKGKFQNGDGTGFTWNNSIPTNGRSGIWICYFYGMGEFERIKNILKKDIDLIDPDNNFEIQEKSNWINGSCEGKTTYSIEGKKRVEIDYLKGLRNGKFIIYRENGTIELETEYKNGLFEFEGNYLTENKVKFEYRKGKWEKYLTIEERIAEMQRQVEEMNKKADILEQQINDQLERQNHK